MKLISFLICMQVGLFADARAAVPLEDPATHVVAGKILDEKDSSKTLFTFLREPYSSGDSLKVTRTYKDLSGVTALVEEIFYEKGQLKKLNVDQKQVNESGGFEFDGKKISFHYTKDGKTRHDDEAIEEPLVVSDTIAGFIQSHWDELVKGETLKARMPVPFRLETIGFKFEKEDDTIQDGVPFHVVKMSASSFVIRMVLHPLYFYLDQGEKKSVLKVVGRVAPKVQKDGKWNDIEAVSIFSHVEPTTKK